MQLFHYVQVLSRTYQITEYNIEFECWKINTYEYVYYNYSYSYVSHKSIFMNISFELFKFYIHKLSVTTQVHNVCTAWLEIFKGQIFEDWAHFFKF